MPRMHASTRSEGELPIDANDVHDEYDRRGLDRLTDAQLFDRAAAVVSIPRQQAANSFVLHAPLELMARRLLLPLVPTHRRRAARERLVSIAARYEQGGDPLGSGGGGGHGAVETAGRTLLAAVEAGDLDEVDTVASQFLREATVDQVMALAAPTVDLLSAAGHAPIAFFLAGRLATTSRSALMLLRPTFRELARAPELRVGWVAEAGAPTGDEASLARALARTPRLGLPGTDFIFPIVHQVDVSGVAHGLLDASLPADVTAAARATLRVAALSMLQDDPAFAPYGWTHCLSLPHAIFEIMPWLTDRRRAAAVAASAWYHACAADLDQATPELIGRAAVHEDAHVAKYTLACLAAAERDRPRRSLYLAAAASLAAWWAARPPGGFRDDL